MLHQFLAIILITIVTMVVIFIIKVAMPMWRFLTRADYVIELYSVFKLILKKDFSKENDIKFTFSKGRYMHKLKFANTREASIEFEKIVQEALDYYDKLGWIAMVDNSFKARQKKLLQICSEVRRMR